MLKNKDDLSAREVANDLLLMGRVFAGAVAVFMILAATFVPWEINSIIRGAILLFSICLSTVIAVGAMLTLVEISERFFRIFKDE